MIATMIPPHFFSDTWRQLTDEERSLLLRCGYELFPKAQGCDTARSTYNVDLPANYEAGVVRVIGEEKARALNALGRLGSAAYAARLRSEYYEAELKKRARRIKTKRRRAP